MEIAATYNPVTYIMESMRSLVLHDLEWSVIGRGFLVVAAAGAVMVLFSVRSIRRYD
jgi:ABC-2 type transport system permease protein